jgi:hypothetical protein
MTVVGYLPDISKNFGYFRNEAINFLNRDNYSGARSCIISLDECLGDEYIVEIDNIKYEEKVKQNSFYVCNHCESTTSKVINKGTEDEYTKEITIPTEVLTSETIVYDKMLSQVVSVLMKGQKTERCWDCPKCEKVNPMRKTKKYSDQRQLPDHLKVIPYPPIRQQGLDRQFPQKFKNWFWLAMEEITWQEYLYRTEYASQHDGQDMVSNYHNEGQK